MKFVAVILCVILLIILYILGKKSYLYFGIIVIISSFAGVFLNRILNLNYDYLFIIGFIILIKYTSDYVYWQFLNNKK